MLRWSNTFGDDPLADRFILARQRWQAAESSMSRPAPWILTGRSRSTVAPHAVSEERFLPRTRILIIGFRQAWRWSSHHSEAECIPS